MTLFTLSRRFGVYPGAEKCAFLADAEIKADSDNSHGKIQTNIPNLIEYVRDWYKGGKKKTTEPSLPPTPPKGGGYPTSDAAWNAYSSLWEEAAGRGYKLFEISGAEMKRYGEVDGFEADDWILIHNDMPVGRKYEVLAHEYAAKLLREERGNGFDHNRDHRKVYERAAEIRNRDLPRAA